MKSRLLLTSFLLAFGFSALAQTGKISGKISDADSTISLSGVSVYLKGTTFGTSTNGNGFYQIQNIPEGTYELIISSIGYTTVKQQTTINSGDNILLNFNLKESVTSLPESTVISQGNNGIKNISGSVSYLSPKELERFNYTDINRTLRMVPGVNVVEEDGFGLRPNIGLRGTGTERSSKITVMEDGILMAPAPYAAPAAYYFPTVGRMQGVEVLKGSSQIKYGPYTTGGAINFISTAIPEEFGGKASLQAGSFGGRNLHTYVGDSHKNFGYLIESFQYSSEGFKELDNGGDTGFDMKDYVAKFRVNTDRDARIYQSLTFKIAQTVETSDETYLGLTRNDFNANPLRRYAGSQVDVINTEQSQFSLTHRLELPSELNITTTAYTTEFARNWYKLDRVKDSNGTRHRIADLLENPTNVGDAFNVVTGTTSVISDALEVKANNRTYYSKGIQSQVNYGFDGINATHNFDLGIRYHRDQIDRFQWVDKYAMQDGVMQLTEAGVPGTESNRIVDAEALAVFLQYQLKIGDFTATPGLRFESISLDRMDYGKSDPNRTGANLSERGNNEDVFIPGIGLDYQFNRYLSAFGGVHKGFSPPGDREETEAESSVNYELGARFGKNALSWTAVLFLNDYSNLLGSDLAAGGGAGTGNLFNGGEALTKGLELLLSYDLLANQVQSALRLPVSFSYTYTDATFQSNFDSDFGAWGQVNDGDELPYLAKNQLAVMVGLEHHKFSINLSGKFMDNMRTRPGQGDIPNLESTDSYFVIDGSASYNLSNKVSFFMNATNLTDEVYIVADRPAGLRPGMPRAFNIGLKAYF